MENRIIFRELLTEMKETADEAGGVLTEGQVREILSGMPLEEKHFQLVFNYLAEQNIRVVKYLQSEQCGVHGSEASEQLSGDSFVRNPDSGSSEGTADGRRSFYESCSGARKAGDPNAEDPETEDIEAKDPETEDQKAGNSKSGAARTESQGSLSFYLDELERSAKRNAGEETLLIERARTGDEAAISALIETYLPLICEMAGDYEDDALCSEDLIQEGNLGLVCAVRELGEYDSTAACRVHILNSIRQAMETAVESIRDYQKLGEGLVSRVNHLNEAVHNLERDLEHKVSAEELSAYLDMPLEEIRSLLNVSGDQISVRGGKS